MNKKIVLASLSLLCFFKLSGFLWNYEATIALRRLMNRCCSKKAKESSGRDGSFLVKRKKNEVLALLRDRANPNLVCDIDGYSLMTASAYAGDVEVMRALLTRGAYVQLPATIDPLVIAVTENRYDIAQLLLYWDADPNRFSAAYGLYTSPLGHLVNESANYRLEVATDQGTGLPLYKWQWDSLEIMTKLLLNHGADPTTEHYGEDSTKAILEQRRRWIKKNYHGAQINKDNMLRMLDILSRTFHQYEVYKSGGSRVDE